MNLWLTRQRDGAFMLTRLKPITERVQGTRELDVYIAPGEPVGLRHLCFAGVVAVWGRAAAGLPSCASILVSVSGNHPPRVEPGAVSL